MGYIDRRIGGLPCDIDENFEQFDDIFLEITRADTLSSSDQYILFLEYILILGSGNNYLVDASLLLEEEYDH